MFASKYGPNFTFTGIVSQSAYFSITTQMKAQYAAKVLK